MVVIFVEAANGHLLFAAPQLALDVVVFPAVAGFQPQSAVGPELSFGAETMRGLDQTPHRFRTKRQRSEEHTSELQSRLHLVCRLLLEKKKKINTIPN